MPVTTSKEGVRAGAGRPLWSRLWPSTHALRKPKQKPKQMSRRCERSGVRRARPNAASVQRCKLYAASSFANRSFCTCRSRMPVTSMCHTYTCTIGDGNRELLHAVRTMCPDFRTSRQGPYRTLTDRYRSRSRSRCRYRWYCASNVLQGTSTDHAVLETLLRHKFVERT